MGLASILRKLGLFIALQAIVLLNVHDLRLSGSNGIRDGANYYTIRSEELLKRRYRQHVGFRMSYSLDSGHQDWFCRVPAGLKFCTISYPSAASSDKWLEKDQLARIKTGSGLSDVFHDDHGLCWRLLKAVSCAREFPLCGELMTLNESFCSSLCHHIAASTCSSEITADKILLACRHLHGGDANASCPFLVEGTESPKYLWAIGLSIAIVVSFSNVIALNLQKLSLSRYDPSYSAILQPLWVLGLFILIVGAALDFVALGMSPVSLLAPLAALTLVWNMIVAPCILKERLDIHQVTATCIIFVGSVITICFSNHQSPEYNIDQLRKSMLEKRMVVYSIVVPSLLLTFMLSVEIVECLSLGTRSLRITKAVHVLGYAGASGISGGQSMLFGKSTAELIKSIILGSSEVVTAPEFYFFISGTILSLLVQVVYLNGGLKFHDSLTVVPLYQAVLIFSGVVGGLVLFDEIEGFTSLNLGLFSFGVGLTMIGVAYLAFIGKSHARGKLIRPTAFDSDYDFELDLLSEDEFGEVHAFPEAYAFGASALTMPHVGPFQVMHYFGVAPRQIRGLLGSGSIQRKQLLLTEMGIRRDLATSMINAGLSVNETRESISFAKENI